MVLRRLAAASLFCLGAAIFVILLHPSSASACGAISYKGDDGSLGSFKKCPSGPGDAGIGAAGGLLAGGTAGGAWWAYRHGGKAAGSALSQPKPAPNPYRNWTGPEPKPNPYRRPQRGGDPKVGDPTELTEPGENPRDQVEGALEKAGNIEQSIAGTVQHQTGVGLPPPPPSWPQGDLFAQGADPVSYTVQMTVAMAAGIRIRWQQHARR